MSHDYDAMEALVLAARSARVETSFLLDCLQRQLILLDSGTWDDDAIEAARRARRLRSLGVNMPGIEIIFHMRHQLLQHQREMLRLREEMDALRRNHEREVARLLRQLAHDLGEENR
jgi:hypothetical protein